jgi:hypothetical protein
MAASSKAGGGFFDIVNRLRVFLSPVRAGDLRVGFCPGRVSYVRTDDRR